MHGNTPRTAVLFSFRDDLDLVRRTEELNYDTLFAAEGQGKTAFGKLERWATVTDEIQLGTGIVNVFSRSPAAVAQAIATLDAHSGGRAVLGLGVAHPGVVEEFHGLPFERPLPRMAEYIQLVRRYVSGDDRPYSGDFFTPERTTLWDIFDRERDEIPIYNAALGPGNVRLTGEHADGWLPSLYPLNRLEKGLDWLAEGAERGGHDPDDVDVALLLLSAVSEDRERARRAAADHVMRYMREIPGYYDRVVESEGFEDEVEAVRAAPTIEVAIDEISDEFLDTVALAGTPQEVQDRVETFRDAGVDMPVIRFPAKAERELVEETLELFSPT